MARASTAQTSETIAVIGKTAQIRGRISGDGDLRVEGTVHGDVAVRGEMVVADEGEVSADVQAKSVIVEGVLEGDIHADAGITIRAGARVKGTIVGNRIAIDEGAIVSGRIDAQFELPPELVGKPSRS